MHHQSPFEPNPGKNGIVARARPVAIRTAMYPAAGILVLGLIGLVANPSGGAVLAVLWALVLGSAAVLLGIVFLVRGVPKELEELHEQIAVKEGGTRRRVSKQRAMLKSITAKAMQGDMKAASVIATMVHRHLSQEEQPDDDLDLTKEDLAILEDFEIRPRRKSPVQQRARAKSKETKNDK